MVATAEEPTPAARSAPGDRRPPRPVAAVRSRWRRTSPGQREAISLGILAVALLLPLRGLLRLPGPPMEEGFMLVFPELVLRGEVPNRDFLHLYGPGSLWVLAGVYELLGTDLVVQRLFGLVQQAGVVAGLYLVARWWGRTVAVVSALLGLVIMLPPAGLTAFAWTGGVALGLVGLGVALHARATRDERRARALAVGAGVAMGAAFLFRLDLVVALVLALGVVVWRMPWRRVRPLLVAGASTAALVVVQLVMAGPGNAIRGMVLEPVFDLRPGRRLPVPPSWGTLDGFLQRVGDVREPLPWPLPVLGPSNQLFLWFFANVAAIALLVGVGIVAVRRDPAGIRSRAVLAGGLFALGMLSQTLQRPDSTHIAWVSCVSIGLVPIALLELLRRGGPVALVGDRVTGAARHARLLATALPVAALVLVLPNFTVRTYADFVAQTFDRHRTSYEIERDGRRFYYGDPTVADAAAAMIPELERVVRPGDRLFVGPADLRRTVTSEAWLYHLFPETKPATYYIEMDPGVANVGTRLAEDLRSADVVILSRIWQEWAEPNDSVKPGSRAPVRVLDRRFCAVGTFEPWFEVYERCDRAARRQPVDGGAAQ